MKKTVVIGGGIAGTTAAVELAAAGNQVVIVEKSGELGGNLKHFGCKAVDVCTKCNLCLVDDILNTALASDRIKILYNTLVNDLRGSKGNYSLGIERDMDFMTVENVENIIVATGYTKWSEIETGTPEIFTDERIVWASEMEDLLENRLDHTQEKDPAGLGYVPGSAVFVQCNGSRSIQEKAGYCSRICCGYNYRLARVLKHFYPEIDLHMFFMDLQEAGYITNITFDKLTEAEINYINCKPNKLEKTDSGIKLYYENQQNGKSEELITEMLILSEGIHASPVNELWSRLFNLQLNEDGFLTPIEREEKTGIYLAGTIKEPMDIAGTISDSRNVAYRIINESRNLLRQGDKVDV